MKYSLIFILLIAFAAAFMGCSQDKGTATGPKELIDSRCSRCHSLQLVYSERPADQWPEIVRDMINKSPGLLKDAEEKTVTQYLQDNYGN